jgi:hypothetical protein
MTDMSNNAIPSDIYPKSLKIHIELYHIAGICQSKIIDKKIPKYDKNGQFLLP